MEYLNLSRADVARGAGLIAVLGFAAWLATKPELPDHGSNKAKPGKRARQAAKRKAADNSTRPPVPEISLTAPTANSTPVKKSKGKKASKPVVVNTIEQATKLAAAAPESDFPALGPSKPVAESQRPTKAPATFAEKAAAAAAKQSEANEDRPRTSGSATPSITASSSLSGSTPALRTPEATADDLWEPNPVSEYDGDWQEIPSSKPATKSKPASTFAAASAPSKVVPGSAPPSKKARSNANRQASVREAKEEAERLRLEQLRQHRAAAAAANAPKVKTTSVPGKSARREESGGMRMTLDPNSSTLIWEP